MSGIVITIAQQKGGSGKTTVAANLAAVWCLEEGLSVAILDVDPQGSLGEWFERREERLGEAGTGLSFRTASGWGAKREARSLARDHDMVLIDTPPHADLESRSAMEQAGLVVVPVQHSPADMWATQATLEQAEKERVASLMILNRVPPRARLTAEIVAALEKFDAPLAAARLGNRIAFSESFSIGGSVIEHQRTGAAAEEVRALAREILNAVPKA